MAHDTDVPHASERREKGAARESNPDGTEKFYAGIIRKRSERP